MAIKTSNFLIMIFSIVLGSIIGELIGIENAINKFDEWVKKKTKLKSDRFSVHMINLWEEYEGVTKQTTYSDLKALICLPVFVERFICKSILTVSS